MNDCGDCRCPTREMARDDLKKIAGTVSHSGGDAFDSRRSTFDNAVYVAMRLTTSLHGL